MTTTEEHPIQTVWPVQNRRAPAKEGVKATPFLSDVVLFATWIRRAGTELDPPDRGNVALMACQVHWRSRALRLSQLTLSSLTGLPPTYFDDLADRLVQHGYLSRPHHDKSGRRVFKILLPEVSA